MSIDSERTVPPLEHGADAARPLPRYERLRTLSRRLNDLEVQQLSPSTSVRFARVQGQVVVHKEALDDQGAERLRREAAVLAALRHPNVVRLCSITDEAYPTMSTEFCGRATLATLLPDDVATVARVCASLCATVDELHRSGWTHGAITADHCIIGPGGRVTLCSLGDAASSNHELAAPARPALDPSADHAATNRGATDRAAMDRSAVARIGEDLLDALGPPTGRRDRSDRRVVRALLRDFAAEASDHDARRREASARFADIAQRRALAGVASTAVTGPRSHRIERLAETDPLPSRGRALLVATAGLCGLLGVIAAMRFLGGPLRFPPRDWRVGGAAGVDRVEFATSLVVSILRIAAFGAALYGVALCAATVLAIVTGRAEVERMVASMAAPRVRALLVILLGVGTVASAAPTELAAERAVAATETANADRSVGSTPAPVASTTGTPTTIAPTPAAPTTGTSTTGTSTTLDPAVARTEMGPHHLGVAFPEVPASESPAPGSVSEPVPEPPPESAHGEDTWTVERGDHLWGIAEQVLTAVRGDRPADDDIEAYWVELVASNRDALVDPDNPDLIYTGQVFVLPPTD